MKTIYKYTIDGLSGPVNELYMPKNAQILTVQVHPPHRDVQLWALVDPYEEAEKRIIEIYQEGQNKDLENHEYITTLQMEKRKGVLKPLFRV